MSQTDGGLPLGEQAPAAAEETGAVAEEALSATGEASPVEQGQFAGEHELVADEPLELDAEQLTALLAQIACDTTPGPRMPELMQSMYLLLARTDLQFGDIVQLVEANETLPRKLLYVANSAYYSSRGKANTVLQAVVRLGVNKTMQLLLAVAAREFIVGRHPLLRRRISTHLEQAYLNGIIAQELAFLDNFEDPAQVYTLGLLHNIAGTYLLHRIGLMHAEGEISVPKRRILMPVVSIEACKLSEIIVAAMELPRAVGRQDAVGDESAAHRIEVYVKQAMFFSERIVSAPTNRIKFDAEARGLGLTAITFNLINEKRGSLSGLISAYAR
ncbi:MAG: HDOD domain-containing protein [Myxococcales bacterium]|nr:HDOD domain-containing protein [Myxococcales bacterium]